MQVTEQQITQFADQFYTYMKDLISKQEQMRLFQYAVARSQTTTMSSDTRVPGTPAAYADPRMEALLEETLPWIEQVTSRSLFPTYSYFRVYKSGDKLEKHTDRFACEFTVSVNLGCTPDVAWPIWIDGPQGLGSVIMQPGDAVVFRGRECPHWRDAFSGASAAQVFLHYVDQQGPLAEWKFDKRRRLACFPKGPIHISERIQSHLLDSEILVMDSGKRLKLNSPGNLIWRYLEAQAPVCAIIEHLQQELGMTEVDAEHAIMKFISRCEDKGLLAF